MASSYTISGGDTVIAIEVPQTTDIVGCYVISDSALNGSIQLKLGQSADGGVTVNNFPEIPIESDTGANSNLLQTKSFVNGEMYLTVTVNTATLGTINFYSFGK